MQFFGLWKSLFRSPDHRLRRRTSGDACFGIVAAEVLEDRELLSAAAPAVTLAVQGSNLTLTSTDINNPTITVTRSGGNVVVTGTNGTLITFGSNVAAVQTVAISTVNNLTVGMGTGNDTFMITGLSVAGNITINGQSSGIANIAINAGSPNVVIGGSIQANLGGEAATFNLFGSSTGGGSLTVSGSVNITESGAGNKQVNLYGPPANSPTGGKLVITGGVSVLDTGTGLSGLRIDDGVTIGGNVSFDNSTNTVSADNVQIFSNSNAFGTTSIAGSLTLALSQTSYQTNFVLIEGFGSSLVVTGAVSITSGAGADNIQLANDWFKTTAKIDTGSSPSFSKDMVTIDGSRFDGATTVTMSGPYPELDLGTNSQFSPTVFNGSFAASLTGASAALKMSNAKSAVNEVVFNSTFALTGGAPFGTMIVQGRYFASPPNFTKTNFNIAATSAPVVPVVTITVQGSNLTLTSSDINNPTINVNRSGNNIFISGSNGTQFVFGSKMALAQIVTMPIVNDLTINLGTGNDTVTITGLSVSGNITINGQASGIARISISSGNSNVVIGGSVQANLGGEAATFSLFGSPNGGGSLTVSGAVKVVEGGSGTKQVNLYGPPGSPFVVTDYTNASGLATHVVQNGTNTLVFIDSLGRMSLGTFFNATQATDALFPGDTATFGADTITWSDGSIWTRSSPTSQVSVIDYTNASGAPTHVITNGTANLVFVDSLGRFSLGTLFTASQASDALYPGDTATFTSNQVVWDDGSVWTLSSGNTNGGKVSIAGDVSVVDTGSGLSGLRIDDGVTIGGNASFDNSANTVNADKVQMFSNSNAFGTTSIAGSLTLALSQAPYQTNSVLIQGFGASLAVTGVASITSGGGADNIQLANVWFKTTGKIDTGSSPSFTNDIVTIDGSRFDGATTVNTSGAYAELDLGTNSQFNPTVFNNSFAALLAGASGMVKLSNATSLVNEVVFNSTAAFTGGTPFATMLIQGKFFVNPGKLTKTNIL